MDIKFFLSFDFIYSLYARKSYRDMSQIFSQDSLDFGYSFIKFKLPEFIRINTQILYLIIFLRGNLLQYIPFDDQAFSLEISSIIYLVYNIFFNSRIMRAQRQSFLYQFVIPSEKVCEVSEKIGFYRFHSEKKDIIYFKRKQIQNLDGMDTQVVQKSISNTLKRYDQELQMSKNKISKYILRYSSVIISYPYACFLHQPYQEMLVNFMKRKLSFSAKISLMDAIAKGINELHSKEICVRTLRPSTVVVLESQNQHFQIAFSQLTDIYENVTSIRGDKSWKLKLDPYNPPELLLGQEYTHLSDIWSLGMLYYQIWFDEKLAKSHHDLDPNNIFQSSAPSWVINFLSKMICPNPKQRFHIKDIQRLIKNAKLCSEVLCKKI